MTDFPSDRFDDVPESLGRVGAHRAARSRRRRWVVVGWSALATGAIVLAGVIGLSFVDDRLDFEVPNIGASDQDDVDGEPTPETPAVTPITDPSTVVLEEGFTITVLEGTGTAGRGEQASGTLESLGWPVGTVTSAAQDDVDTTVVYYSDPELEGVALGMTVLLDVGVIEQSDAFPGAPITIVLGADFSG